MGRSNDSTPFAVYRAQGLNRRVVLESTLCEWIDDLNACRANVGDIPRHEDEAMDEGGRGNQAIDRGKRVGRVQEAPFLGDPGSYGKKPVRVFVGKLAQPPIVRFRLHRVVPTEQFDTAPNLADGEDTQEARASGCRPNP